MKILTKQVAFLFTTAILSSSASAGFSTQGPTAYAIDIIHPKQLARDCGSFNNASNSSIFGSLSNYMEHYPNMGKLSSELESIRIINGGIKAFARDEFSKAKVKRDNVYKSNNHTNSIMERNKKAISTTNALSADTMSKYKRSKSILQDTSDYIAKKTVEDITNKLKRTQLNNYQYMGNNYDVLVTCRQYWKIKRSGGSFNTRSYEENQSEQKVDSVRQYQPEVQIKPELPSAMMSNGQNTKDRRLNSEPKAGQWWNKKGSQQPSNTSENNYTSKQNKDVIESQKQNIQYNHPSIPKGYENNETPPIQTDKKAKWWDKK